MFRAAFLAALLLFAGCSSTTVVWRGSHNGAPLVSIKQAPAAEVREACLNPQAAACAMTTNVNGVWYAHYEFAYEFFQFTKRQLEGIAHEVCHTVAHINQVPDPCHNEDGGHIH